MKPSYRIAELEKIVDAFRQRAFEAERESDEFTALAEEQSELAGRNAARSQKAEADEDKQQIVEEYDAAMCASNEAGYAGITAADTIRYLIQRAEAAEEEIERRDAAAGEPVYQLWSPGIDVWVECNKQRYDEWAHMPAQRRTLYTVAPPSALPPEYADELKDRAELIEAYSKTQCEIAQDLGCDSDNESILKAIYELKALRAQSAVLPPDWYFQLTFEIPGLDNMTPYQAHGAAWKQCRDRAKSLGAQPHKPVVLPEIIRHELIDVLTWIERLPVPTKSAAAKAIRLRKAISHLDAANVPCEVKK